MIINRLLLSLLTGFVAISLSGPLPMPSFLYHRGRTPLVPAYLDGVGRGHVDTLDVALAGSPAADEPPETREFWVAAGRHGEYQRIGVGLVAQTGRFRLWAQDATAIPTDMMIAAASRVDRALDGGLLGALLETAAAAHSGIFPVDIVYSDLSAMGGYFSAADQPGFRDNPFSNETQVIYVSLASCNRTSGCSAPLIAHEMQHLLQFLVDPQEETWFNEGLSEIAEEAVGAEKRPDLTCSDFPLFDWSLGSEGAGLHYEASASFLSYWKDRLGEEALIAVATDPRPAGEALRAYLHDSGNGQSLDRLFLAWQTELLERSLSDDENSRGENRTPCRSQSRFHAPGPTVVEDTVSQYGCDQVLLPTDTSIQLSFTGEERAAVIPVAPPEPGPFWWSGGLSNGHATLTATLDLHESRVPRLEFWAWHDLEDGYDWAYVAVSEDDGRTWRTLETDRTTDQNTFGNNPGNGLTGASHDWLLQAADLSAYAGQSLLVRFGYLADDAIEGAGFAVTGVRVADPESEVEPTLEGWTGDGFSLLSRPDPLDQRYGLVAVGLGPEGTRAFSLPLKGGNTGQWVLPLSRDATARAVLVCGLTEGGLSAPYRLEVTLPETD